MATLISFANNKNKHLYCHKFCQSFKILLWHHRWWTNRNIFYYLMLLNLTWWATCIGKHPQRTFSIQWGTHRLSEVNVCHGEWDENKYIYDQRLSQRANSSHAFDCFTTASCFHPEHSDHISCLLQTYLPSHHIRLSSHSLKPAHPSHPTTPILLDKKHPYNVDLPLALTVQALIPLMRWAFEPCMHADTQHPRSPLLIPRCRRARPSHQITCCYVQPQQQRSIAICWGHTCRGLNEWLAFWWLPVPPVFSPPASQIAAHCWDRGLF